MMSDSRLSGNVGVGMMVELSYNFAKKVSSTSDRQEARWLSGPSCSHLASALNLKIMTAVVFQIAQLQFTKIQKDLNETVLDHDVTTVVEFAFKL